MKNIILVTILTLLISVAPVWAQPDVLWSYNYTGLGAKEVIGTIDGGYAMSGGRNLVHTDSDGAHLWTRTYDGGVSSVVQTTDGGFAMAGALSVNGGSDFYLVKADADGNLEWQQTYDNNNSSYDTANDIIQTADGGYALFGTTYNGIYDQYLSGFDYYLVKTDADGNQEWAQSYNSNPDQDQAFDFGESFVQTADGGYALAGQGKFPVTGCDFWLVRTDPEGAIIWDYRYGDVIGGQYQGSTQNCYSLTETSDGGFALAGNYAYPDASSNGYVVKTDANGNQDWEQFYNNARRLWLFSITNTSDGGYALGGQSGTVQNNDGRQFLLIKTDINGDTIWNQIYGGAGAEVCESVIQTPDGGYALAGLTDTFGQNDKFWLVRLEGENIFDGYNDFVQTDSNHTLLILGAEFNDEPIPSGWQIGIFTPRGVLAGGGVWTDDDSLGLAAFGDDETTDLVEGFIEGERIFFRLYDNVNRLEYSHLIVAVYNGDAHYIRFEVEGMTALQLNGTELRHFNNFVETAYEPVDFIESVKFDGEPVPTGWEVGARTPAGILAGGAVVQAGRTFMLEIFADDPDTAPVEGLVAGERISIFLWNPENDTEYPAWILSDLDVDGEIYSIESKTQGWYEGSETTISLNGYLNRHYTDFVETDFKSTIVISVGEINDSPIATGWEVGAFTSGGILAGGVRWQDEVVIGFYLTGDNPETEMVEGFTEGEVINFRFFDVFTQVEYRGIKALKETGPELDWPEVHFYVGTVTIVKLYHNPPHHFILESEAVDHEYVKLMLNFNNRPVPSGWEVGCFTLDGILAGAGVWIEGDTLRLLVNGDDPETERVEGFIDDQRMHFRAWNPENDTEYRTLATNYEIMIFDRWGNRQVVDLSLNAFELLHFNDFVETDERHTLSLDRLNISGEPAPNGSEVGAFTPDGVLAGACVWDDTDIVHNRFHVFGDNPRTREVEGFLPDQPISIRVWDGETEYPALSFFDIFTEVSVAWHPDSSTTIGVEAYEIRTMTVDLLNNWNLISINVVPSNPMFYAGDPGPEIVPMMAQFGDHLVLMKDERGHFYWPANRFNNIEFWNFAEGYLVKMNQAAQGSWTGVSIPAGTDVPIDLGWNYIGYFPTYQLGATQRDFYVVSPILNNVLIAKNRAGQFMIPRNGFSNMVPWRESQGYQIKVSAPVVLNYPDNEPGTDLIEPLVEAGKGHWNESHVTGINMSVLVSSIAGVPAQSGDQIAAFGANGSLVGVGNVQPDGKAGIAIWGDDASTGAIDGLQNGEAFTLRLWSSDQATEFTLKTNIDLGQLIYETDGFTNLSVFASALIPETFYISESYPNPFNSTTRIAFGLPEAGRLSIGVYDMAGRLVASLAEGEFAAGNHTAVWNADAVPAGLYMVKMQAGNFSDVRKLTLVK